MIQYNQEIIQHKNKLLKSIMTHLIANSPSVIIMEAAIKFPTQQKEFQLSKQQCNSEILMVCLL